MKPKMYRRLIVLADQTHGEIWLCDQDRFLVCKQTGSMDVRILPGRYYITFNIKGPLHGVMLSKEKTTDVKLTQKELEEKCKEPTDFLLV